MAESLIMADLPGLKASARFVGLGRQPGAARTGGG